MIRLTLEPAGQQPCSYIARRIPARAALDAHQLVEAWDAEEELTETTIDQMLDFVVRLFEYQFTRDEFLDGFMGNPFVDVPALVKDVILDVQAKVAEYPPTAATATAD